MLLFQVPENPGALIVALLLALQGIPLFPVFFALGTEAAREHFRLICPECGHKKPKGGDFFYNKALCTQCKATW